MSIPDKIFVYENSTHNSWDAEDWGMKKDPQTPYIRIDLVNVLLKEIGYSVDYDELTKAIRGEQ